MKNEPVRKICTVKNVDAEIHLPPSKSYTNRALIVSALAEGTSTLVNPSLSDDSLVLMNALKEFGVEIHKRKANLEVTGTGGVFNAPSKELFIDNAGTAMRFLATFASLANGTTTIDGNEQMQKRPIGDLLLALQEAGIKSMSNNGCPPITIEGGNFLGGRIGLNANISSQFASSILLSSPYSRRQVMLHIKSPISSLPYIDMSLHTMRSFGGEVEVIDQFNYRVSNQQKYIGHEFHIEADASSASYFFAAGSIVDGKVVIPNLAADSLQGDLQFLSVLSDMGCHIVRKDNCIEIHGSRLRGVEVDMNMMPDCVPTLAVLACFAEGPTTISNVAHLEHKETNRLKALAIELQKIGARIDVYEDGLTIYPQPLHGAEIETYNDHRMAMSFAVAGLRVDGISIKNPACVSKSFPDFWDEFSKLESSKIRTSKKKE